MTEPYTIHMFVVDGDPDGLKIVDRQDWIGWGIAFPPVRVDSHLQAQGVQLTAGVYILSDAGKHKVVFSAPAKEIRPVPFRGATPGLMQGPHCTALTKLLNTPSGGDLFCSGATVSDSPGTASAADQPAQQPHPKRSD